MRALPIFPRSEGGRRRALCSRDATALLTFAAIFLLWLGCVVPVSQAAGTAAEHFITQTWQVTEGLPDNNATSVVQTPDGYLWVGTQGGLARFDGVRFEIFDGNTPGLEGRQIQKLFVDMQGGLWISLATGQLARHAAGKFTAFHATDGWSMKPAVSFAMSRSGDVLISDAAGVAHEFRAGHFGQVDPTVPLAGKRLQAWTLDSAGTEWALDSERRLHVFRGAFWEPFAPSGDTGPLSVAKMAPSKESGLWVFDARSIRLLEAGRWTKEFAGSPELTANSVVCILDDSAGNLWVGASNSKLFRFGPDHSRSEYSAPNGFPPGGIGDVCEDREGNLWVASRGSGLIRLKRPVFRTYAAAGGLPSQPVLSLAEDSPGRLLLGSQEGGILVLENGRFFGPVSLLGKPVSVRALRPGRGGGMWAGTEGEGLLKLQGPKSARWSVGDGLMTPDITVLFEDRAGVLWIGSESGLSRFDGSRFTHFSVAEGLSHNGVQAITQDSAGDLWVGTVAGLNRFRDGKFTAFYRRDGLPSDDVRTLLADPNGVLWIGTLDGGLSRFSAGQFVNCSVQNGLPDNSIKVLLDDGLGYLWLGTGRGICRVSHAEFNALGKGQRSRIECVTYLQTDGLASIQCSAGSPAGIKAADGNLWFATAHGVSLVDPRQLRPNLLPPPVVIEEFSSDGEVTYSNRRADGPGGGGERAALAVSPGRRHLEIAYTALSFTGPAQNRFRIRLEGADADWRDVGPRRVAFYDGLPPGAYRFRVIAANNDGVWNETGDSLAFAVLPFYWQTWWFRGGLGLALAGLALRSFRRRIVRRERERTAETLRLQGVALACAGDGIVITDRDGGIVWTNPAFTQLSGYAADEVAGRNVRLLNSGTHPPEFFEEMWTTLLAGKVWQAEIINRNKDGGFSTLEQTTTPVRDSRGEITHFVAINRDISIRKRMEKALGESEERFRTLALATLEGIIIYDGHVILEVNRATSELFGYPSAELIGQPVFGLVEAGSQDLVREHFRAGSEQPLECQGRRKNGTRFDLEVHCRSYPFQGRMVRVAAVRDVTEANEVRLRMQFLVQQKALETERSRIARDMHDEMGSSLTRITLLSEAAEFGLAGPNEADQEGARVRLQRIAALGRSLVISMDEIVWAVNPGNDTVEAFASYLCHFAPELLKVAGIQCRLSVPQVLPQQTLHSEARHHLFLVVKEALHNVIKHSGATLVTLTLQFEFGGLVIDLADDGRGFEMGELGRQGNGLINMRQRMNDVGGQIEFTSAPGRGTRITLRLKLCPATPR